MLQADALLGAGLGDVENRRTQVRCLRRELLLFGGADVNLKDAAGKSALARAVLRKHDAVITALKEAGAVEEGGQALDLGDPGVQPAGLGVVGGGGHGFLCQLQADA